MSPIRQLISSRTASSPSAAKANRNAKTRANPWAGKRSSPGDARLASALGGGLGDVAVLHSDRPAHRHSVGVHYFKGSACRWINEFNPHRPRVTHVAVSGGPVGDHIAHPQVFHQIIVDFRKTINRLRGIHPPAGFVCELFQFPLSPL